MQNRIRYWKYKLLSKELYQDNIPSKKNLIVVIPCLIFLMVLIQPIFITSLLVFIPCFIIHKIGKKKHFLLRFVFLSLPIALRTVTVVVIYFAVIGGTFIFFKPSHPYLILLFLAFTALGSLTFMYQLVTMITAFLTASCKNNKAAIIFSIAFCSISIFIIVCGIGMGIVAIARIMF